MKDPILKLLGRKDYAPANVPELLRLLRLQPRQQQELQSELRNLEQAGLIARIKGNRYIHPQEADLISGRIRMNRQGTGYLQPDDLSLKEIEIPLAATSTALHEDRVLVRRDVRSKSQLDKTDGPDTGSVVRILERRRMKIVGTLRESQLFLYVVPDDPRIPHDIYVPAPRDVGRPVNPGDKVVVELREWESRHTNPEGEIIEVLGPPDAEGVDMLSILRQYQLPLHFPQAVLNEARAYGTDIYPSELAGREDCREDCVVTIDPDDAKDFDDAICLQRAAPGQWRLWVHIADVSHYVKPGTALDEEARLRGNSTYLVDRVIPMLPEALSNELCSLKPNVDRLTKCAEFLLSDDGRVLKTSFYSAVIHSKRRFSYREALEVLQHDPVEPVEQMLHDANKLAQRIRRLRFKAGSLDLDFPESKIRLDERGRVLRIEKVENDISHQLIEEFMLLANEAAAARLISLKQPTVHRVHEPPSEKRIREYRELVLSHDIPCGNLSQRLEVQKLMTRLSTLPIGPALKIGFLKSLMRARYAVEPLGHYGLAKDKYTHFTSPIRRYSDLVVHRGLFQKNSGSIQAMKEIADHISVTERNSADAERDSKDVKMLAFLKVQLQSARRITYPALVTDLRNFGFFVEVSDLGMSGLVHLSSLEDDFYLYEPARNHLIGRRTRRIIRIGDHVEVQIAKADLFKKQVDFQVVPPKRAPLSSTQRGQRASARPSGNRTISREPLPPRRVQSSTVVVKREESRDRFSAQRPLRQEQPSSARPSGNRTISREPLPPRRVQSSTGIVKREESRDRFSAQRPLRQEQPSSARPSGNRAISREPLPPRRVQSSPSTGIVKREESRDRFTSKRPLRLEQPSSSRPSDNRGTSREPMFPRRVQSSTGIVEREESREKYTSQRPLRQEQPSSARPTGNRGISREPMFPRRVQSSPSTGIVKREESREKHSSQRPLRQEQPSSARPSGNRNMPQAQRAVRQGRQDSFESERIRNAPRSQSSPRQIQSPVSKPQRSTPEPRRQPQRQEPQRTR